MSSADAVAAIMFGGIVLYSIFAGADFGSGVWDLLAGNARRGATTRRLIDHSIGPVWEANHVWLIFVLVFLWTGFPEAFGALMRDVAIPMWLVGLGIVLRGAGFAFRRYAPSFGWARAAGATFALSSVITPFFLGVVAGAIASGRVTVGGSDESADWITPTSMLGGVLAVLTCAFLAATFLTHDADRLGNSELFARLRVRAIASGVITGAVALLGVAPLSSDAPTLADGLTGRGAPIIVASGVSGLVAIALLWQRRYSTARIAAVGAVAFVVIGWGVGQYPWILVDELTIDEAAGDPATITALLVGSVLSAILVAPPLAYLFVLADSNRVGSETP